MTKTKGKKGGKRLTRAQLIDRLEAFFSSHPDETFTFKEIFRELHLDTHPLKMLAIDIMEEMAWDDFLIRVTDSSYKLADGRRRISHSLGCSLKTPALSCFQKRFASCTFHTSSLSPCSHTA